MVWRSIYFNKELSNKELMIAIAETFKITLEDIIIVNDICELLRKNIQTKMVCERYELVNDIEFKLRIDINFDDELEPQKDIEVYSALVNKLNCKLLVDDYSEVPDSMLVIEKAYFTEEDLNKEI